jgi:hypothetical protein
MLIERGEFCVTVVLLKPRWGLPGSSKAPGKHQGGTPAPAPLVF